MTSITSTTTGTLVLKVLIDSRSLAKTLRANDCSFAGGSGSTVSWRTSSPVEESIKNLSLAPLDVGSNQYVMSCSPTGL